MQTNENQQNRTDTGVHHLVALGTPAGRVGHWALKALESILVSDLASHAPQALTPRDDVQGSLPQEEGGTCETPYEASHKTQQRTQQSLEQNASQGADQKAEQSIRAGARWEIVERWGAWALPPGLQAKSSKVEWETLVRQQGAQSIVFIGEYPNKTQDVLLATSLGKAVACVGVPGEGLVEHAKLLSAISNAQRSQQPLTVVSWRDHCPAHQWMAKRWKGWERRLGGVKTLSWRVRVLQEGLPPPAHKDAGGSNGIGAQQGERLAPDGTAAEPGLLGQEQAPVVNGPVSTHTQMPAHLEASIKNEDAQHSLAEALDFLWTLNPQWRHERAALHQKGQGQAMHLQGSLGDTQVDIRLCQASEAECLEIHGPLGGLQAWPERGALNVSKPPKLHPQRGGVNNASASAAEAWATVPQERLHEQAPMSLSTWISAGADWGPQEGFPVSTPQGAMVSVFREFFLRSHANVDASTPREGPLDSELRRASELHALRRRSFLRCHWMDRPQEEALWAPRHPKSRSEVLPAHLEAKEMTPRERFRASRAVAHPWVGGVRGFASNDPSRPTPTAIRAQSLSPECSAEPADSLRGPG